MSTIGLCVVAFYLGGAAGWFLASLFISGGAANDELANQLHQKIVELEIKNEQLKKDSMYDKLSEQTVVN